MNRRFTQKRGAARHGPARHGPATIIICTPFYHVMSTIPHNKSSDYLIQTPIDVPKLEQQYSELKSLLHAHCRRVIDIHDFVSPHIRNNPSYVNLLFTQDHFIQTPRGIIMARMKEPIRRGEPRVVKQILEKHALGPIYTINKGFLEGGDYILHNNVSYIMDGPRTNMRAIDELFHKDLFGTPTVIVLYSKMPDEDMHRIHLDTIMNFADKNTVVVWKGALAGKHQKYVKVLDSHNHADMPLRDYLIKHSFNIMEVSNKEQTQYKCNFVNVPQLGILSQTTLGDKPATLVDFDEVNKLYGGLRCSIKVV